ncbi:MAG: hypothetical protein KDA89_03585, partial [Planctomycetaceae bacterium]|nr:hypothetical protein [Planctomycetaceae bacterium]
MELRTDVLTGRQIIVAHSRGDRPVHVTAVSPDHTSNSSALFHDPFLEGEEQSTPDETLSLRRDGTAANTSGWLVRVVPNRFPAVQPLSPLSPL